MATPSTLVQRLIALYASEGTMPFFTADPAGVTVTAGGTQAVITCTFTNPGSALAPAAGAISRGRFLLQCTGIGTQSTITTVNATISDGTSTETVAVIPAPTAAISGRGLTYIGRFETSLTNVLNVLTLAVTVTLTGTQVTTSIFQAVAVGNP